MLLVIDWKQNKTQDKKKTKENKKITKNKPNIET